MSSPWLIIEPGAVHNPSHNPLAGTFDVDIASLADSRSVTSQDVSPQGIVLSTDGQEMFVVGLENSSVYRYSLSDPCNVATASHTSGDSYDVSTQEIYPEGVTFSPDGTRMFVVGDADDRVYQYDLDAVFPVIVSNVYGFSVCATPHKHITAVGEYDDGWTTNCLLVLIDPGILNIWSSVNDHIIGVQKVC